MSNYNYNDLRKTNIVATIGPATESLKDLEKAFLSGMTIVRCNFSHGSHEEHGQRLKNARIIGEKYGVHIPVFADIQGPKYRVGAIKNEGFPIKEGQKILFDSNPEEGDESRVCLPHPKVMKALNVNDRILIDDGKVCVKVVEKNSDSILTEVISGNMLKQKKGFLVPDITIPGVCLTEKDFEDIEYINTQDFDAVAVSFVENAEDLKAARKVIAKDKLIISKLERSQIVPNMEELVEESDIVMIARGDLGVEIPPYQVPIVQKQIIDMCKTKNTPVIIATHMLESMIDTSYPTRSEVSDVANGVFEGTDCLMLSAETTVGDYPFETLRIMDRTAKEVENSELYKSYVKMYKKSIKNLTQKSAFAHGAVEIAADLNAKAIIVSTETGETAVRISKRKPNCPIVALTTEKRTLAKLGFCANVIPVEVKQEDNNIAGITEISKKFAKDIVKAKQGDNLVFVLGNTEAQTDKVISGNLSSSINVIKL